MKQVSSSLQLFLISRSIGIMKMSSTSNSNQGRIWTHRPFEVTPSCTTTTTTNPSISHCPLPIKTPTPPLEDRIHSVYQSGGSEALAQLCQSKHEFYKTQFSSRLKTEDTYRIRKFKIPSSSSSSQKEVDVTIYLPKSKPDADSKLLHGICLHVHGGGWIWGDSQYQVAHRCLEMTEMMNVAVVSVEYSLASTLSDNDGQILFDPVSEVESAIDWIETTGADELNSNSVFVASGESSGAHLLLLSMLSRRDRADGMTLPSTWKCLNLVYGFYDLSGTPSVRADGNDSSPMCGNELLCMADLYYEKILQQDGAKKIDRQHPSISPIYANLSNLPPALITVGTADPLLDDSLFLASRYSLCGNDIETVLYEGGEHGIGHFGLQEDDEMGRRAREYTLQFMKRYIDSSKHKEEENELISSVQSHMHHH